MIALIYNEILFKPLLAVLITMYNIIPGHDMGIAIIALTFLVRIILYPLQTKAIRSQKAMQKMQPEIEKIKEKYKNDKEAQTKATMEFYKQNKINPVSGCLPLLIQLPIIIALYKVFQYGMDPNRLNMLYPFIHRPEMINPLFLGFMNLSSPNNFVLAILAAVAQFFQSKMLMANQSSQKKPATTKNQSDFTAILNQQMIYFLPFITFFIAIKLPAALALYFLTTTIFALIQQYFVIRNRPLIEEKK